MSVTYGSNIRNMISACNWATLHGAKVVVMGESNGHTSVALAAAFPNLRVIIQDSPQTISTIRKTNNLSSLPQSVTSRVTFQSHDFTRPQPVRDADVYVINTILSQRSTTEARQIVQRTVDAMSRISKARMIIVDTVQPGPRSVRTFNSTKRDLEDWMGILAEVQPALTMTRLRQVEDGTGVVIVEAIVDAEEENVVLNVRGESMPVVFMKKADRRERSISVSVAEILPED